MSDVQSADDAGGKVRTDYDAVNAVTAAEILKHAQALVAAQHTGLAAVEGKLTATLAQSVTLSLGTFGAAALPFAARAWLPVWAGMGFFAVGVCAATAAVVAVKGLDTRSWAAPGLSPEKTDDPGVLLAAPQTTMMFMAWSYQKGISKNTDALKGPTSSLRLALRLLSAAPLLGVLVAVIAAVAIMAHGRLGV